MGVTDVLAVATNFAFSQVHTCGWRSGFRQHSILEFEDSGFVVGGWVQGVGCRDRVPRIFCVCERDHEGASDHTQSPCLALPTKEATPRTKKALTSHLSYVPHSYDEKLRPILTDSPGG